MCIIDCDIKELFPDEEINRQRAFHWLPPLESTNKKDDYWSWVEALDINQIMIKERSEKIIMWGLPDKKTIEQSIAKYVWAEWFVWGTEEYAEKLFAWDDEKVTEYLINSIDYQKELEIEANNTENIPLEWTIISSEILNTISNLQKTFPI